MDKSILAVAALAVVFLATVLILKKLIPILKSRKMGQKILEIGPRWHKSKEGTPTMGGIAFIIPAVTVGILACVYIALTDGMRASLPLVFTLGLGLAGGLIGCVDDLAKLRKKQNEGLTAPQKFVLQVLAAGLYLLGMGLVLGAETAVYIPFVGKTLELGIFYWVFAVFMITGIMNSVNLTDGIDGLCSSVTLLGGVFFAVAAFLLGGVEPDGGLLTLGALLVGGCAGFLVYNFYPARVFMGDTGSLFLGGLVIGGVFMMKNPLIVLVFGFWYVLETASVILQVGFFKLTHGKRLFKMSPIHHHFEKCGWSEIKIVAVASAVTAVLATVALLFGVN